MSLRLINSNSIFFHIPKTGGTWVHKALENSGVKVEQYNPDGHPHSTYIDEDIKNKFTFTFVRHPFNWYNSYWCYRIKTGWELDWHIDKRCRSNNFETFLKNIIDDGYPYVKHYYDKYIGEPQVLNYIGKQEYLVNDLIGVLKFLKEDFNEKALRRTPRQNVSEHLTECDMKTYKKILKLEHEVLRKWGY